MKSNLGGSQRTNSKGNFAKRDGAVTVEFAVCASIFFMIILGMLELSRFIFVQNSVQMAAYEATRAGIVPGATVADVRNRANNILQATGVLNATVSVNPTVISSMTEEVTVTVDCNFSQNSWLPPTFLTNHSIRSDVTLDHENKAFLQPSGADLAAIGNNNNAPLDQ